MSTGFGQESKVQDAVRWISDQRLQNPHLKLFELIDEAGRRFDLSPLQSDRLAAFLREGEAAARTDESE